ncbi:hypothetical protein H4R35_006956 [Dimargaris xerosporica]|nr:hypothetical protein H4R35_006956 [Dimargaris xerosporica]
MSRSDAARDRDDPRRSAHRDRCQISSRSQEPHATSRRSRWHSRSRSPISKPLQSQTQPVDKVPSPTETVEANPATPAPVQPNFGLSGKLAADTNTVNGTVVDYNEPPEARRPVDARWRLYVFKGDQQVDMLHVSQQSAYLFGRDRQVVDIPIDHPSCSKQHAVLQYRQVAQAKQPSGSAHPHGSALQSDPVTERTLVVKPYLIDLESSNGTMVNNKRLPPVQYYELRSQDVIKFAFSTRDYVFIQE